MVTAGPPTEQSQELLVDEAPDFQEVLVCVFGIREREVRTYLLLLDDQGSTTEELAAELDRDRSNVNRTLVTLREKGLVTRESKILPSGGNVFQYRATPVDEAQEMMHETLDEWTAYVHSRIEEFGPEEI